jgi:phage terminase large subunit-like protein
MSEAEKVAKWIGDYCYVPEGRFLGQQVKLQDWQIDLLVEIYDRPGGCRRAILSIPRKDGKTAFSAFLLLAHLMGPRMVPNSQLYSAAQSREQAALIFSLASKMCRMNPRLNEVVVIRDSLKELFVPEVGVKYKALSAEASTAYGLSPVFIVHDELGQVRGPRSALYEALETSTGAQENPLSLVISTQAPNDGDLLSILIDDALAGNDARTFCQLYTAPLNADPFAIETIRMCNPALGTFQNEQEVLAMAADAKRMRAREPEFRNLVLNQRVEALAQFVSPSDWKLCDAEPVELDDTMPIYAGLDLSEVSDLTALVLIGKVGKVWQVWPTFWLPEVGLADKARADHIPYDLWHQQGFLKTTPGRAISYEHVAHDLRKICDSYRVKKIGFDRWNYKHLKPWLLHAGFVEDKLEEQWVEFGQGTQSMSPALRDLESLIANAELAHGNNPVLTMCAMNSVVEGKDKANRKLSKSRSTGRIDGMVALAMAVGVVPVADKAGVDIAALIG